MFIQKTVMKWLQHFLIQSRDHFLCALNVAKNSGLIKKFSKFYDLNNSRMIDNEIIGNTFIKIFNHGKLEFRIGRDHVLRLNIGENV